MSFAIAFFILAFLVTIYLCGMSIAIGTLLAGKGGKITVSKVNIFLLYGSLIAAFICTYKGW
jgi:hypothetical protein